MRCSDKAVVERAKKRADLMLGARGDKETLEVDRTAPDQGVYCSKDRTLINQRAFENMGRGDDPAQMPKGNKCVKFSPRNPNLL